MGGFCASFLGGDLSDGEESVGRIDASFGQLGKDRRGLGKPSGQPQSRPVGIQHQRRPCSVPDGCLADCDKPPRILVSALLLDDLFEKRRRLVAGNLGKVDGSFQVGRRLPPQPQGRVAAANRRHLCSHRIVGHQSPRHIGEGYGGRRRPVGKAKNEKNGGDEDDARASCSYREGDPFTSEIQFHPRPRSPFSRSCPPAVRGPLGRPSKSWISGSSESAGRAPPPAFRRRGTARQIRTPSQKSGCCCTGISTTLPPGRDPRPPGDPSSGQTETSLPELRLPEIDPWWYSGPSSPSNRC